MDPINSPPTISNPELDALHNFSPTILLESLDPVSYMRIWILLHQNPVN